MFNICDRSERLSTRYKSGICLQDKLFRRPNVRHQLLINKGVIQICNKSLLLIWNDDIDTCPLSCKAWNALCLRTNLAIPLRSSLPSCFAGIRSQKIPTKSPERPSHPKSAPTQHQTPDSSEKKTLIQQLAWEVANIWTATGMHRYGMKREGTETSNVMRIIIQSHRF